MVPIPPHVGHGPAVTIWPSSDRRTWRTSPAPSQVAQRVGCVPGRPPEPPHVSHSTGMRISTVRRAPVTTSASVSSITRLGVGPASGAGRAAAAEHVAAEERVEEVVEAELTRRRTGCRPRPRAAVGAEHVVLAAPLGIAHHLVRGVDLLEALGRAGIVGIRVGVALARELRGTPA